MKREKRSVGAHVASGDETGGRRGGGGEDVAGAERRRASHHRRHLENGAGCVEDDEIAKLGPLSDSRVTFL